MRTRPPRWRFLGSGAVAGAVSAFAFAGIHHVLISDIWFSLLPMMAAGAVCGLCIGWTYGRLFEAPSAGTWWVYNGLFLAFFVLLGLVSVLVFEPVTTAAAVIAADRPPEELFGQAMPLTLVFTLAAALGLAWRYGRGWKDVAALLLTCAVLMLLLGLNVSVLGLVEVPLGAAYMVAEMFALLVVLDVVFAALFSVFERRAFARPDPAPVP